MSEQESTRRTRIAFGAAIVAGQLSILLPGPSMDPLLYGLSCLIVLGIVVAGAMPSVRASGPAQLWLALAYVGVIVLLRQAAEGPTGGFAPLVILPAMWLALYGSRRQLLIELAVTFVALALPWALIGGDQYPASTPRSALLVLAVAAIAGLSIQRLLEQVRASRDRLSGVLAAATGNAIVATDREGTITVFNPGAERMLGYRAEEVVGGATPALFLTDDIEPTFEAFAMALASERRRGDARADLRPQGRDAPPRVPDADDGARPRRARRRLPRRRHGRDPAACARSRRWSRSATSPRPSSTPPAAS